MLPLFVRAGFLLMLLGVGLEVLGGIVLERHGTGSPLYFQLMLMLGKTHLVLVERGHFAVLGGG